ncbi:hypothetical protein MTP99_015900 [Tenebrio molitor]|nr:hypothetical protein MTP99_015900 [Tenebrio molitor]
MIKVCTKETIVKFSEDVFPSIVVHGYGIAGSLDKAIKTVIDGTLLRSNKDTIIDGTLLKRFQLWTQVSVAPFIPIIKASYNDITVFLV